MALQPNGAEGGYLVADVDKVTVAGALLRLDLHQPGYDDLIRVEIPRGDPARDRLKQGDRVYVRPINQRVFVKEAARDATQP